MISDTMSRSLERSSQSNLLGSLQSGGMKWQE